MTCLIVDDEPEILKIGAISLGRVAGWRVLVAESADEALDIAVREVPDVILMDVRMPGTDGVTAVEKLKREPPTRQIPIILMTAEGSASAASTLPGAAGVIAKPFDPMALADEIRRILARQTAHRGHGTES